MKNFYTRLALWTLLVIVIYALLFYYVDRPVAYAMASLPHGLLYYFGEVFKLIGKPAIWSVLSVLGLGFFIVAHLRGKRGEALNALAFVCASNVLAAIICDVLKDVLARYRPIELIQNHLYGFHFFSTQWVMNSTPSGHATLAFSLALSLSFLFRRFAVLFFLYAFSMLISRIFVNEHFVSDVVLGAYIGIISVLIIRHMYLKIGVTLANKLR